MKGARRKFTALDAVYALLRIPSHAFLQLFQFSSGPFQTWKLLFGEESLSMSPVQTGWRRKRFRRVFLTGVRERRVVSHELEVGGAAFDVRFAPGNGHCERINAQGA